MRAVASRITAVQSLMTSVVCDGGNGVVLCCRRHLKLPVGSVCPYLCPQTMFAAVDVDDFVSVPSKVEEEALKPDLLLLRKNLKVPL